ncbi:MAG: hypothetical protein ACLFNK_05160 [Candidatus Woesearchaeota archaeon]
MPNNGNNLEDDILTFGDCFTLAEVLKSQMKDLDSLRIYVEGQDRGTKLFYTCDFEDERYIIFCDGKTEDDPHSLSDRMVNHLHLQKERSYGVFGRRVLGDITLEKKEDGYVYEINSGHADNDKFLSSLENLIGRQAQHYSPS